MPPPGTKSRTAGAGLGLSIAKAIVAAHGGALAIEAAAPRGTRVHIQLPIEEPPDA
jgi:signal transduction histidine kinase